MSSQCRNDLLIFYKEHTTECHKVTVNSWSTAPGHHVNVVTFNPQHCAWERESSCWKTKVGERRLGFYLFGILLGTRRLRFQPGAQEGAAQVREPLRISLRGVRVRVYRDNRRQVRRWRGLRSGWSAPCAARALGRPGAHGACRRKHSAGVLSRRHRYLSSEQGSLKSTSSGAPRSSTPRIGVWSSV